MSLAVPRSIRRPARRPTPAELKRSGRREPLKRSGLVVLVPHVVAAIALVVAHVLFAIAHVVAMIALVFAVTAAAAPAARKNGLPRHLLHHDRSLLDVRSTPPCLGHGLSTAATRRKPVGAVQARASSANVGCEDARRTCAEALPISACRVPVSCRRRSRPEAARRCQHAIRAGWRETTKMAYRGCICRLLGSGPPDCRSLGTRARSSPSCSKRSGDARSTASARWPRFTLPLPKRSSPSSIE